MSVLDDYRLQLEDLPGMTKRLLINPVLRAKFIRDYLKRLNEKYELNRDVPKLRFFKRLHMLEGKLDKPFIYDSQLLTRIEELEKRVYKRKVQRGTSK